VRLSPETCRVKPLRRIKTQLLHLVGLISLLYPCLSMDVNFVTLKTIIPCIDFGIQLQYSYYSQQPIPSYLANQASILHSGDRAYILTLKPTKCTNFSNLFLKENSTCFGQFFCPSSGV